MFLSNTNIDATGLKPRFELDLNYPQRLDSNYPLDYPDSNCTRTQSKEFLDIQATIECICVYSLWNAYVTWQEYTDKYRFWTFFLHDLKWKKNNKKLQSGSDFPLVKFLTLYQDLLGILQILKPSSLQIPNFCKWSSRWNGFTPSKSVAIVRKPFPLFIQYMTDVKHCYKL